MEMPKLSDAHRQLHRLNGNWEGSETLSPSPWDPVGGAAIGKSYNRIILDGFGVAHDYEQYRGGECSFRGHGVFTWDARDNMYYLHWFDSMCTTINTYRGRMDGDVLNLDSVNPEMKSRASFDLSRPDGYTFKMDVSPDGTQWMTFMEGRYGRLPDAPRMKTAAKSPAKSKAKAKSKPKAKPAKKAKATAKKGKPAAMKSKKQAKKKSKKK